MKPYMKFSLMRLCFILGVGSAISYEYGDENAEKMAALGDRLSQDPYYTFTEEEEHLIQEAINCYNQLGYIMKLPKLY